MKKALVLLVIVSLFLVACTSKPVPVAPKVPPPSQNNVVATIPDEPQSSSPAATPPPPNSPVTPPSTVSPPPAQQSVKTFHIKARRFEFNPAVIEVNKGDTVTITAETQDVPHGLKIRDFNVDLKLNTPGEVKTATFVADKAGEFDFFCSTPCGTGHGSMKGTLIVHEG